MYAVFEAGAKVDELFSSLHRKGYNGTYLSGASINTMVASSFDEEPAVLSLPNALSGSKSWNATFFLILEEKQFDEVKALIEDYTGNFKKIRGGLFMWPLTFFEGSF